MYNFFSSKYTYIKKNTTISNYNDDVEIDTLKKISLVRVYFVFYNMILNLK